MQVRVLTMRYQGSVQGFSEDELRKATFGREVLSVEQHFFVHGGVPHLTLVLTLSDGEDVVSFGGRRRFTSDAPDPAEKLPPERKTLYQALKSWRNELAKAQGRPAYTIARNGQLAELVMKAPKSLAEIKEIEGCGEAFCRLYGKDILKMLAEIAPALPGEVADADEDKSASEGQPDVSNAFAVDTGAADRAAGERAAAAAERGELPL